MKQALEQLVATHKAWTVSGETLVGIWKFDNFNQLRSVVSRLCDAAEKLNHHPTVTYGYNTLRVETTTHDAGNVITVKDIELAEQINVAIEH